jgi:Mg-chelatase subunit ChlD
VVIILALSVVAMGGVGIGRMVAVRRDAQRAADVSATIAADLIRQRGVPFTDATRTSAETVGRGNSALPMGFVWTVQQTETSVDIKVATSVELDVSRLVWPSGRQTVGGRAGARILQQRFTTADRRLPKLVLVLDYSGSMNLAFSGGGYPASTPGIRVLRDSVVGLLTAGFEIELGAVLYSSSTLGTPFPISGTVPNALVQTVRLQPAGGGTNTADALTRARALFTSTRNTGYHILLISDGAPDNVAAARAAAEAAWNDDITIHTLEIRRAGSSQALDDFMTAVAGEPSRRGNPLYHHVAQNAATLVDKLRGLEASVVCQAGPVTPAPADAASVQVFLEESGVERKLEVAADLSVRDRDGYQYSPTNQMVKLTKRTCAAVIEGGNPLIVRYDGATLYE